LITLQIGIFLFCHNLFDTKTGFGTVHRLANVDQRKLLKNRPDHETQRRAPRRTVRPGSNVIFKKTPRFRFFGKPRILHTAALIDISTEGLRARYTAPDKWSSPFDHIAITDADNTIIVDDIYCKIISDVEINYSSDGRRDRVCGVKFSGLNGSQRANLKHFIKNHTVREEESSQWHVQFD
jgi:hypothetical protein